MQLLRLWIKLWLTFSLGLLPYAMEIIEKEIPFSEKTYRPSSPFVATVLENQRLTSLESEDDIRHLVFDLAGSGISYIEGQSLGVVAPGMDERGKRHRLRLYSISSARIGDDNKSSTVSLTVKRLIYKDEEGNTVRGVTSNYLCDLKEGDKVEITGPTGRHFVLPQDTNVDLILVAVGTGIAPFRAFIHEIYRDYKNWSGEVCLFYGAKTGMENLYQNSENNDIGQYMDKKTFKAFAALSRTGERRYVHEELGDNLDEIWTIMERGNFSFYLCGMKALEQNVDDLFRARAEKKGIDWDEQKEKYKKSGRWNIEVY